MWDFIPAALTDALLVQTALVEQERENNRPNATHRLIR